MSEAMPKWDDVTPVDVPGADSPAPATPKTAPIGEAATPEAAPRWEDVAAVGPAQIRLSINWDLKKTPYTASNPNGDWSFLPQAEREDLEKLVAASPNPEEARRRISLSFFYAMHYNLEPGFVHQNLDTFNEKFFGKPTTVEEAHRQLVPREEKTAKEQTVEFKDTRDPFWRSGDPGNPASYLEIHAPEVLANIQRIPSYQNNMYMLQCRAALAVYYAREYNHPIPQVFNNIDFYNRETFGRDIDVMSAYVGFTRGNMSVKKSGKAYQETEANDFSPYDLPPGGIYEIQARMIQERIDLTKMALARKRDLAKVALTRTWDLISGAVVNYFRTQQEIRDVQEAQKDRLVGQVVPGLEEKAEKSAEMLEARAKESRSEREAWNRERVVRQREAMARLNAGAGPGERFMNYAVGEFMPNILYFSLLSTATGSPFYATIVGAQDQFETNYAALTLDHPELSEQQRRDLAGFSTGVSVFSQFAIMGLGKAAQMKFFPVKTLAYSPGGNGVVAAQQIGGAAPRVFANPNAAIPGNQQIAANFVYAVDKSLPAYLKLWGINIGGGAAVGAAEKLIINSVEIGAGIRSEDQRYEGVGIQAMIRGGWGGYSALRATIQLRNVPSVQQYRLSTLDGWHEIKTPYDRFAAAQQTNAAARAMLTSAETPNAPAKGGKNLIAPVAPRGAGGVPAVKPSGTGTSPLVSAQGGAPSTPATTLSQTGTSPLAAAENAPAAPVAKTPGNAEIAKARIVADAADRYAADDEVTLAGLEQRPSVAPDAPLEERMEGAAADASDVEHIDRQLPHDPEASREALTEILETYPGAKAEIVEGWTPELRAKIEADGTVRADRVPAFHDLDTGISYFNVSALRPSAVDGKFVHEVLAHQGIREVLGPERAQQFYLDVYRSFAEDPEMAEVLKKYGIVRNDAYGDPVTDEMTDAQRAEAADEFAAAIGEETLKPEAERAPWYRRALFKIREILRKFFPKLRVTLRDIETLLREAAHRLRRQRAEVARGQDEGVRFAANGNKKTGELLPFRDLTRGLRLDEKTSVAAVRQSINNIASLDPNVKTELLKVFDVLASKKRAPWGNRPVSADTFLTDMLAAGFKRDGSSSVYRTVNENTVRIANHSSTMETFTRDNRSHDNVVCIIIEKPNQYKKFQEHPDVNGVEYVFPIETVTHNQLEVIVHDIAQFFATGEYFDHVGAKYVHYSGSNDFKAAAKAKVDANAKTREDAYNSASADGNVDADGAGGIRKAVSPVYTGSAADYEAPSLHYVGTGEGAQAYGWGLYGSSKKQVGEYYARQDAVMKQSADILYDGTNSDVFFRHMRWRLRKEGIKDPYQSLEYRALSAIHNILIEKNGNIEDVLRVLKNNPEEYPADYIKILEAYRDRIRYRSALDGEEGNRHLYEQSFWPDKQENLLDWDTLISREQLDQIHAQLKKEGLFDAFQPAIGYGEELYKNLVNVLGGPKAASEFLYRAGIDGITYIGDDSGVRNYVAFSDKDIRIDRHVRYAIEDDDAPLVEPKPFDPAKVDYEDADQRAVQVLMARYATAAEFDDEEVADYLRGAGFVDITPEQAHKLTVRAREEYRQHRQAEIVRNNARRRDDWLYDNIPLYRHAVDFGGKGFRIKLDKRVARKDDSGTFLARKNEGGIDSSELAKYIARVEGRQGQENEIEEEIADFFRELKKPDLYRRYYDYARENREGERELDRQAKAEFARYLEDQARDIIEAGQEVKRETLEDNKKLAAVLYNQLLGKPFTGRITNGDLDDINYALTNSGNNPRLVSRISRAIRETMQQEYVEKMRDFRDKLRGEIRDAKAAADEAVKLLREFLPPQYRGRYVDDLVRIAGITNAAQRQVAFDKLCEKITKDADIAGGADLAAKITKDKIYFELPKGERDRYLARLASIMKLSTPEKRIEAFDKLQQEVMDAADAVRKVKYLDRINTRLAQLTPKVNRSRRIVGTRTIDAQEAIATIAQYVKLTSPEVEELQAEFQKQIDAADASGDATGAADIEAKLALLDKFGALAEKSGDEVFNAYDALQRLAVEGRNDLLQEIAARKAEARKVQDLIVRRVTSGAGVKTGEAAAQARNADREKFFKLANEISYGVLKLEDMEYLLSTNGETGDWLENPVGKLFQQTHIAAVAEKTDAREFSNELNAALDNALGSSNAVSRAVKLQELRTRAEHTGIWRFAPEQRKIEYDYVTEDQARVMIAEFDRGEGTLKTYQAELLRARLRDRAVKMERSIESNSAEADPSARAVYDAMDAETRDTKTGKVRLIGIPRVTFEGGMYEWNDHTQLEALSIKFAWGQRDGRYHLEINGWTEESIKQLDDFLLPETKKLGEWILDFYDRQYGKIDPVYRNVFYAPLPKIEHYAPLIYPQTRVNADTATPGLDDPAAAASAPRRLTPGSIKMRTAHLMEPVAADALTVLVEQARGTRHFIYWAEHARDLRGAFFTPEVKDACDQVFGGEFFPVFKKAILDTVNGGVVTPVEKVDQIVRGVISNAVSMRMLFGYVSGVKQMMSGFAYANDVPLADFARCLAYSWAHPASTIATLLKSDYLKNRFTGGADIFEAMAFDTRNRYVAAERIAGKLGRKLHLAKTGAAIGEVMEGAKYWGSLAQRFGDSFPVVIFGSAVYRYHYQRMIDEGFSPEEAEKHALLRWEMSSESLQQSAAIHNQNALQKSIGGKLLTVFKSANILGGQRTLRDLIAARIFGKKGGFVDDEPTGDDGQQYSGSEAGSRGRLFNIGVSIAALTVTGFLIKLVASTESDLRKHPNARKKTQDALLDAALEAVTDNASIIPGGQETAEVLTGYLIEKRHGKSGGQALRRSAENLAGEDFIRMLRDLESGIKGSKKRKSGKSDAEVLFEGVAHGLRGLGLLSPNLGAPGQAALQGKRIIDYFRADSRRDPEAPKRERERKKQESERRQHEREEKRRIRTRRARGLF